MKKISILTVVAALLVPVFAQARVHQTAQAESAYKGDGSSAQQGGELDVKDVNNTKVARVKGSMNQWGYVTYWMGVPTPSGASSIRFRIYKTSEPVARYLVYIRNADGQQMLGDLAVPADAPNDSFVDVDMPVNSTSEWSGIIVKKASGDTLPSPWLDSISVVVP